MNPIPFVLTLIAQHPDAIAALLSFVVLGLVNGLLPTKVNGNLVTRVISVLVDRVGRTSYTLRYDICRGGESEPVRARARVTYVEVDLGTGRPAPLPEELHGALLTAAARCA